MSMQIRKKQNALPRPAPETKRASEARLAWAAGAERLKQHDPLWHVTESFQQSFDRIGLKRARAAADRSQSEKPEAAPEQAADRQPEKRSGPQKAASRDRREDAAQGPGVAGSADALTRFSEIAFRRGAMSASVLNGTGKMMLVSCLRRTAAEAGPQRMQRQELLRTGSQTWAIPGHGPDQIVFNRGFVNSALGIVTDTLRDARAAVDSMAEVAREGVSGAQPEYSAMFKLYPFLDDSRDAALEAEYREKLAACADEREKPVLQNALVQTRALRAKKAQMKNEFISKLRFLSARAEETRAELEAPGILDELTAAAFGGEEAELPENPEEDGGPDKPFPADELIGLALGVLAAARRKPSEEGADGDAPNGTEKRSKPDEAGRAEAAADPAEAEH